MAQAWASRPRPSSAVRSSRTPSHETIDLANHPVEATRRILTVRSMARASSIPRVETLAGPAGPEGKMLGPYVYQDRAREDDNERGGIGKGGVRQRPSSALPLERKAHGGGSSKRPQSASAVRGSDTGGGAQKGPLNILDLDAGGEGKGMGGRGRPQSAMERRREGGWVLEGSKAGKVRRPSSAAAVRD